MLIPTTLVESNTGAVSLIFDSTLGSAQASFDITGIPSTYKHLHLIANVRCTAAIEFQNSTLRVNGDTGSNYDQGRGAVNADLINGASTLGSAGLTNLLRNTGATALANRFAANQILFVDYTGSSHKLMFGLGALFPSADEADAVVDFFGGQWRNTSAIDQITLLPGTGNWDVGSRVTLYGLG